MRHLKSLGVIALSALFMMPLVSYGATPPAAQPPHTQSPATTSNNRFVIFFSPFARADVYLVDTQSGRVWKPVTYTDIKGQPEVWMPQNRFDTMKEFRAWVLSQESGQ